MEIQSESKFLPPDRRYTRGHFWAQEGVGGFRVGFTEHAVRMLPRDFLLEWIIPANTVVRDQQPIGRLETNQGLILVHSPAAGRVVDFNPQLLEDSAPIQADPWNLGWLFHFETEARLLTAEEYAAWLSAEVRKHDSK